MPDIENLYKAYKDEVQFFLVYLREAHPARAKSPSRHGAPQRPGRGRSQRINISQHKNMEERVLAATQCVGDLKISLPTLIDDMEGTFLEKYWGFQAGTAIVSLDGKILFHSHGPRGAKPQDAERVFKALAAKGKLTVPSARTTKKPPSPTSAPAGKASSKQPGSPAPPPQAAKAPSRQP